MSGRKGDGKSKIELAKEASKKEQAERADKTINKRLSAASPPGVELQPLSKRSKSATAGVVTPVLDKQIKASDVLRYRAPTPSSNSPDEPQTEKKQPLTKQPSMQSPVEHSLPNVVAIPQNRKNWLEDTPPP